ncbi:MAG: DUF1643 domain-containing protein [Proteocatella sp.]
MSKEAVHEYRDYVVKQNISINRDCDFRYSLSVPLRNSHDRSVLVIMKNPSKADNKISDHTINNVIKFCNNSYNTVHIMNLFPYYATNPEEIKKFISSDNFSEIMEQNISVLSSLLGNVDDIIVAWGGNSIKNKYEYHKAISSVIGEIKRINRKVYAVRKKKCTKNRKYPWHAQVWAVNHDLEKYEWKL